jgi:carbon-monoxide dehydrogenase medium subunit
MPTLRDLVEYHKPTSFEEALKLLRRPNVRTVPIAGGTALVPSAAREVEAVVDLNALGLAYIKTSEVSENLGGLEVGATTTLQSIVESDLVRDYAGGVLVKAALDTATRNIRDAATLAGSIVAAEGNSPLLTTLLALDARLVVRGDQEEEVAVSKWTPHARSLIVRVILPPVSKDVHVAYEKVARTPADMPIVCVAVRARIDNDQLHEARIALGGVAAKPIVIETADATLEQAIRLATEAIDPPSDYFASAAYRREMIGVLIKRCVRPASEFAA